MDNTLFGLPVIGFAAAVLFFLDHAFFAMSMAIKTYFQKIADPADISPTAGTRSRVDLGLSRWKERHQTSRVTSVKKGPSHFVRSQCVRMHPTAN